MEPAPRPRRRRAAAPRPRRRHPALPTRSTPWSPSTRPEEPMHCLRPAAIAAAAPASSRASPGETLYAVKCNPEPAVLRAVWDGGVRHFDCASAAEVRAGPQHVPRRPASTSCTRSRRAAPSATPGSSMACGTSCSIPPRNWPRSWPRPAPARPQGLGLFVRLALPKGSARHDLSGKFGAAPEDAARAAARGAAACGAARPAASMSARRCLDPLAWRQRHGPGRRGHPRGRRGGRGGRCRRRLPRRLSGHEPPPLGAFFAEIEAAFEALALPGTVLWAEPGRALVAGGGSRRGAGAGPARRDAVRE